MYGEYYIAYFFTKQGRLGVYDCRFVVQLHRDNGR